MTSHDLTLFLCTLRSGSSVAVHRALSTTQAGECVGRGTVHARFGGLVLVDVDKDVAARVSAKGNVAFNGDGFNAEWGLCVRAERTEA